MISTIMTGIFLAAALSSLATAQVDRQAPQYCVIAIIDGTPTAADLGVAERMVSMPVFLPNQRFSVIYPANRGGAWTIDEQRAFVPFGGKFPGNYIHDMYAQDLRTGMTVGINPFQGLFVMRKGNRNFAQIPRLSESFPKRPNYVRYSTRLGTFIVAASNGLFAIDHAAQVTELRLDQRGSKSGLFGIFDVPALNALLLDTADGSILLRTDDGETLLVGQRPKVEFLVGAKVQFDQASLVVETNRRQLRFPLPKGAGSEFGRSAATVEDDGYSAMPAPGKSGSFVQGRRWSVGLNGYLESDYRSLHLIASTGERRAIYAPAPDNDARIVGLVDLSASEAVMVFTTSSAWVIQRDGTRAEIAGIDKLKPLSKIWVKGLMPERNEVLVSAIEAIYLVADVRLSGTALCARP